MGKTYKDSFGACKYFTRDSYKDQSCIHCGYDSIDHHKVEEQLVYDCRTCGVELPNRPFLHCPYCGERP